jgi:4-amino-4-deoxy-L-arabinose transferase-like glycosyltransferase
MERWGTMGPRLSRALNPGVVAVAALVVLGAIARLVGLTWGLPAQLGTDEWIMLQAPLDMYERGSFDPAVFYRPDHVEIKLDYLVFLAYSALVVHVPFPEAYAADPGTFLLLARLVTVAFGVASIVLAALIGRRFSPAVAVIAAALFAFFPPLVEHAHYATPDVPLTTVFLGVVLATMHYVRSPRLPALLVAAALAAVAVGIKYPGGLAAVIIALVVVVAAVRDRRPLRILQHGAIAIAGMALALFLVSPVLFTNVRAVVDAFSTESGANNPSASGLGFFGNLVFYADTFVAVAGVLLTALAVYGVADALRHRRVEAIPLALGAITWLALSPFTLHWERWTLPMYVTPLLFAALGAVAVWHDTAAIRADRAWPKVVAGALGLLVIANLVVPVVSSDLRFVVPDTRIGSKDAIAAAGATPENTAFEGYTRFLPTLVRLDDNEQPVFDGVEPDWIPNTVFDRFETVDGILRPRDDDLEFVLISDCLYARFLDGRFPVQAEFYRLLDEQYDVVARFPGVDPGGSRGLEPLTIGSASHSIAEYAGGAMSGCDQTLYRIPAR